ncbi:MAG: type II toxin-antitoxin system VapC family toxin [Candidatus Lindowbacteria bacterium]|nr:type II toxin-antitoxin system VapC family toxin [Candidatus Lindowbacteria bacterium]
MRAVLDTNAVIYLQKGLLAEALPVGEYFISVITEMELLSFHGLDESQRVWLNRFIVDLEVIGIDSEVKRLAIELRRRHRLRLPDAIIAGSAITCNAVLLSNDQKLMGIPNLQVQRLALRGETP